jgi:hypothetical protein
MDEKVTAIIQKNGKIIGYCTCSSNGYKTFDEKTSLPTDEAVTIELASPNIVIDTSKSINEIFSNLPIGTPFKIKGCCEGMCGQQLIYAGKEVDFLGTTWHMVFDGSSKYGGFPEAFGYATKQLNYDDVQVIFNDNDIEKVEELQDNFSYLLAISHYV